MQLPIEFKINKTYCQSNFITAPCNLNAYQAINNGGWINNRLLIIGESGAGKTHLVKIWQNDINAILVDNNFDLSYTNQPGLIIENIHDYTDEYELVKYINFASEYKIPLLLTSQNEIKAKLPDLDSRLQATQKVYIERPSEQMLKDILKKEFADRQWRVTDYTINYIATHAKRSFSYIQQLIYLLDKQNIITKKEININLVKSVMNIL